MQILVQNYLETGSLCLNILASALSTHPSMRGIGRGANRGMTKPFFGRGGFNRGRGFGRGFGRGRGRGSSLLLL